MKNEDKQRNPEMRQTRNGKQRHFEMKHHIGFESESGLPHSELVASANAHDKRAAENAARI